MENSVLDNQISSREENLISKKNSIKFDIKSPIRKLSDNGNTKELAIIKSNFEMSLNSMKNEVKQLNKDFEFKDK